jgi:tRNA(Ile)-lysidine synthase
MRPGPRRPILGLRRADTVALCDMLGFDAMVDATNADTRFLRNRVRHEILPMLSSAAARDLVPVLCRQADLLRDDEDLLQLLAADIDPTDARALAAVPAPIARRAVRRWIASLDPRGCPPDAAAVERVLDVAAGRAERCELAGGIRIGRRAQRLRCTVSSDSQAPTASASLQQGSR